MRRQRGSLTPPTIGGRLRTWPADVLGGYETGRDPAPGRVPLPAAKANKSDELHSTNVTGGATMRIKVTSIYVDDQDKALRFYTDVLGFVKKADFTQGHSGG
jgi:hypothetical protein